MDRNKLRDVIFKLLGIRNNSILAHGSVPVSGKNYEELRDLIKNTFGIESGFKLVELDWRKIAFFDMES